MEPECISLLEDKFEETVAKMEGPEFTSHDFLLKLSQANQKEYIAALHHYSSTNDTPFRTVHGILMKKLKERTDLVICLPTPCKDEDIFGDKVNNACWQKVQHK